MRLIVGLGLLVWLLALLVVWSWCRAAAEADRRDARLYRQERQHIEPRGP